jgi:hypothetical protein
MAAGLPDLGAAAVGGELWWAAAASPGNRFRPRRRRQQQVGEDADNRRAKRPAPSSVAARTVAESIPV